MKQFVFFVAAVFLNYGVYAQNQNTSHIVQEGETLYSIARKYKVDVKQIFELNGITDREYKVKVGETLYIAKPSNAPAKKNEIRSSLPVEKIHVVQQGETIYKIAKQYEVSPENLSAYNHIQDGSIQLGQKLKIPPHSNTSIENIDSAIQPNTSEPVVEKTAIDHQANKADYTKVYKTNEATYFDKGMAIKIAKEKPDESSKFYAFHATAPIGTILKVRNLVNDKVAFVKIIAHFEPELNSNVLIQISATTYDYLEAGNEKFLVEISYVNQKK